MNPAQPNPSVADKKQGITSLIFFTRDLVTFLPFKFAESHEVRRTTLIEACNVTACEVLFGRIPLTRTTKDNEK